jgi:hypothetical protein
MLDTILPARLIRALDNSLRGQKMKRLLMWTICSILLSCSNTAKIVEPKLIIEVRTAIGTDVLFDKDHIYLRVFDNGQVEYWDKTEDKNNLTHHESQLSASQLKSFIEFLDDTKVKELSGMYPAYPPQINFGVMLSIFINRGGKNQEVGTHFYKLPLGRRGDNKSPQALVDLICRIESLRQDSQHWITPEGYCSK